MTDTQDVEQAQLIDSLREEIKRLRDDSERMVLVRLILGSENSDSDKMGMIANAARTTQEKP